MGRDSRRISARRNFKWRESRRLRHGTAKASEALFDSALRSSPDRVSALPVRLGEKQNPIAWQFSFPESTSAEYEHSAPEGNGWLP